MLNNEDIFNKISDTSTNLEKRFFGKYYTPKIAARGIINEFINQISLKPGLKKRLKIIDPFGGDGRLIKWLIEEANTRNFENLSWDVTLWDINDIGLHQAKRELLELRKKKNLTFEIIHSDAFTRYKKTIQSNFQKYDFVLTNPPWYVIKPDRRIKISDAKENKKDNLIKEYKAYDTFINRTFPLSKPKIKFGGWGTDLSRVGLELCHNLVVNNGYIGIVLPPSFLADQKSYQLRKFFINSYEILLIDSFPAESKLFIGADVGAISCLFKKKVVKNQQFFSGIYDKKCKLIYREKILLTKEQFLKFDYTIPVNYGQKRIDLLNLISNKFPSWHYVEKNNKPTFWAGRELDETGSKNWLEDKVNGPLFIKGKNISRYEKNNNSLKRISKELKVPKSSRYTRIIWRDISRRNQKRRMIATLVEPDIIAGNSLGVVSIASENDSTLKTLLGIMNSFCFEFQLRSYLFTGHISLGSIRKVCIPNIDEINKHENLANLVDRVIKGEHNLENQIEIYVSKKVYGLTKEQFKEILYCFEKYTEEDKNKLIQEY